MSENKICGGCEVEESSTQCDVCSKDLCSQCVRKLSINISGFKRRLSPDQMRIGEINLCEDCIYKAGRINPATLLDNNGFTKIDIVERLRKNFMIMSLDEENEEQTDNEENYVSQINRRRDFA